MANNDERNRLQAEALHDLCYKNRVILNWGTGVGKSKVAADAFDKILARNPDSRFLLVVQETAHKMNWKADIAKHLGEERMKEILSHTTIECYASLKNYRDSSWSLIVFDEAHHLRSEARMDILSTMSAARVLALSATINDQGDGEELLRTLDSTFGEFTVKTFDMTDAINSGILGRPDIHVVALKLNPAQQKSYDGYTARVDAAKERYKEKRREAGLIDPNEETPVTRDFHDRWMITAGNRKRYIGNLKTSMVAHLLDTKLKDKKLVCFCANVKQVEKLGGKDSINAEHTRKENLAVIEAFNNNETDRVFAVGMIQEGQNLNGIEAGLITQLDNKSRSFIQKLGRVMRSDNPLVYILFVPDTRDEEYLENALMDIDREFIHFDNCEPTAAFRTLESMASPAPSGEEVIPSTIIQYTLGDKGIFEPADSNGGLGKGVSSLRGEFVGIGRLPARNGCFWYEYKLFDRNTATMKVLTLHQKMSIGYAMQLSGCSAFKDVSLSVEPAENGFPTMQAYSSGRPLAWIKRKLPPKNGSDDSQRMVFIDSLVDEINNATGYSEDIF